MLFTRPKFVGTINIFGLPTDPKSALFHADRLASLNMHDWARIHSMKNDIITAINIKIVTNQFNRIFIHKDCANNFVIDGFDFLSETVKSLAVDYVLPKNIKNSYEIQDIIASELLVYKYKVTEQKYQNIYLQAVLE